MTPKEKAKELFDKMDMIIYTDQDNWKSQCKQCALIAVDEIINNYEDRYKYCNSKIYWEEVQQEIEKL
jgi:protein-tyrosine-phosphatase